MVVKQKYNIIVAHPDDEVIFFSSILKSASKIIICFSGSKDKTVCLGRKIINEKKLLKKTIFLNLDETDVFNKANWQFPVCKREGLLVNKNRVEYQKNFLNLKNKLSKIIKKGNIIYTHNPWGEYGHEEHVQVFKVIKYLEKKFKLTIFVNGYVSNKSYNLMKMQEYLLSNIIQHKTVNKKLTTKLKKIYIANSCWTFDHFYNWPRSEIFFQIYKSNTKFNLLNKNSSSVPLSIMSGNYKVNFFKKILEKIFTYNQKKKLKNFLHKIFN